MSSKNLYQPGLYVGCTRWQHANLFGPNAGINARAGEAWRNDTDPPANPRTFDYPRGCSRYSSYADRATGANAGHRGNKARRRMYEVMSAAKECKWCGNKTGHWNKDFCQNSCARDYNS